MMIVGMSLGEIILGVIALGTMVTLGFVIFLKNPRSWTNRFFVLLTAVLALYVIVNPISLHPFSPTPENQLFWIRIVMFLASFMGPLLFFLVHTFPRNTIQLQKKYLIFTIAFMLFTAAIALGPFVFKSIEYPNDKPMPVSGLGMPIFLVNFIGFIILSFVILIMKYRKSVQQEKIKLFHLFAGICATFSLMAFATVLSIVIFKTSAAIFLGPIFPVILTVFIAYSITKHRFLDIHPLVVRAATFFILLIIITAFYSLLFFFAAKALTGIAIPRYSLFLIVPFNIVIIFGFQPLYTFIKKITDKIFFQDSYNSEKLLYELTHTMAGTLELEIMIMDILKILTEEMRLSKAALLIMEGTEITDVKNFGFKNGNLTNQGLEKLFSEPQVNSCYIFEDLPDSPLKDFFRDSDIYIAMPIYMEREPAAILVLGPKLSGEIYFQKDLDLLNIFSAEAGIAIRNAKAYEKIIQFSRDLEKMVDERTKELKEAQQRELQKAKEVSRLKDEFVFVAAHELRTPVVIIRGFLDLVSAAGRSFPKEVKRHLDVVASASNNLNQLIDDLLEIARSETGTMKVAAEPVNVSDIINITAKEMFALARKRKIKIKTTIPEAVPMVLGDAPKIKEVLANLLTNAIKYNKENGSVNISAFVRGDYLFIEIRDTGYGILENNKSKIFQKFFRSVSRETQEVMGTGLGLFISRMLVEKMGGKIIFSSVEGEGSTFAFSLPIAKN